MGALGAGAVGALGFVVVVVVMMMVVVVASFVGQAAVKAEVFVSLFSVFGLFSFGLGAAAAAAVAAVVFGYRGGFLFFGLGDHDAPFLLQIHSGHRGFDDQCAFAGPVHFDFVFAFRARELAVEEVRLFRFPNVEGWGRHVSLLPWLEGFVEVEVIGPVGEEGRGVPVPFRHVAVGEAEGLVECHVVIAFLNLIAWCLPECIDVVWHL